MYNCRVPISSSRQKQSMVKPLYVPTRGAELEAPSFLFAHIVLSRLQEKSSEFVTHIRRFLGRRIKRVLAQLKHQLIGLQIGIRYSIAARRHITEINWCHG